MRLHESLLFGDKGLYFVGTSGLLLLSSVVMGLANGWPRSGQWRHPYKIGCWRTTSQKLFGWHRMLGLTFGAVALPSAMSGAYLAFAPEIRPIGAQPRIWLAAASSASRLLPCSEISCCACSIEMPCFSAKWRTS